MVQQVDIHRWHSEKRSAALFVNAGQYQQRIEAFGDDHRAAVCQAVEHRQYQSEAVKQRHTDAELCVLCEAQMLPCREAIVADAIMCEHSPFGEAGGATGVLYVDGIVAAAGILSFLIGTLSDGQSQQHQLIEGVHTLMLLCAHIDHSLHIREADTVKFPAFMRTQFW